MSQKPASGRKRESDIWKYFLYDGMSNKSECSTCSLKVSGKNSTNLKRHLQFRHADLFALVSLANTTTKAKKVAVASTSNGNGSGNVTNTTMHAFVGASPYAEDSNKYKRRCDLLAKYLVSASIPVRTMENMEFREFSQDADPRFEVPG